ncbi:hypothetical protein Q5Y75_24140 [Ruegeria sp. 2205SS24-7]|uniref:hypothetical protein n=1 Tax=Ruegeria discodermiae TaxID=3064389 RepID=UPI0027425269|nr:hypothetical protein [Ruegeria sp. 2205SS24-7]MDP5220285.1 hypothetical protein [Ruegeria sp. 2205SS24-7]
MQQKLLSFDTGDFEMFGPFSVWSPEFRFPLSGNVQQEIEPTIGTRGIPAIEARVQREVASYGTQLGKVLEALQALSAETGVDLPEIDALIAGVEGVKTECKEVLRDHAAEALRKLKEVDQEGYLELVNVPA